MNQHNIKILEQLYKKYIAVGATILLSAWIVALLTVTFLPGPYTFDFLGVIAEQKGDISSVTVNSLAIGIFLIAVPLLLSIVEFFKRKA